MILTRSFRLCDYDYEYQAKLVKWTHLIATGHLINELYQTKIAQFISSVNATYISQPSSKQFSLATSRRNMGKNPVIQTSKTSYSFVNKLDTQVLQVFGVKAADRSGIGLYCDLVSSNATLQQAYPSP